MRELALLCRRLVHAIDNYGLRGAAGRLLAESAGGRRLPGPSSRADRAPVGPHPFDLAHGTDTGGYIPGEQLGAGNAPVADLCNTAYYGISPSTLTMALSRLPVALDPFTFIDLGCGKGRALLLAAQFPFGHVLGVELSPELAAVAGRNCATDRRIRVQVGDASRVQLPATPFVAFLYHPFLAPLEGRVFRAIVEAVRAGGQSAFVLLANPSYPRNLARMPALRLVWDALLPLSAEDAAADRHGITGERYLLYRVEP